MIAEALDGQRRERGGDEGFDLVDHASIQARTGVAGGDEVGDEQGIARGEQSIQMADAGLLVGDEMEVVAGGRIGIDDGIFFVCGARAAVFAVEAEEHAGVESVGKAGWRVGDLVWAFALAPGEGVRDWLEHRQRRYARAADEGVGAIGIVVGWKAEVFNRPAEVGARDDVQFVCAESFRSTVNTVVFKVKISGRRMESEPGRVADTRGDLGQVGGGERCAVINDGDAMDGVARKRAGSSRDVFVGECGGAGGGGIVDLRADLEEQVVAVGEPGCFVHEQFGVLMHVPAAGIGEEQSSRESQRAGRRRALAQHGDGMRSAHDENQVVHDPHCRQRGREIAVKNRSGVVSDAVAVGVGEAKESSGIGAAGEIGILHHGHEERAIGEFRHAQWEADSAGEGGDAKVVGVHARTLNGEGLGGRGSAGEARADQDQAKQGG